MISSNNGNTSDREVQKVVRRFPENNNNTSNSDNNINSATKSEMHHPPQPHIRRHLADRDSEHSDRKVHSVVSGTLTNFANNKRPESDQISNMNIAQKRISTNPSQIGMDDTDSSFYRLKNVVSSQIKSESKISQVNVTKHTHSGTTVTPIKYNEAFADTVLQNGDYLTKYNSWHEFRGADEIKKCSRKVIERNENIWELVAIEYSHFKLLVNIRDVYYKSYPYMIDFGSTRNYSGTDTKDSGNIFESVDAILPGIDPLIDCHAKICDCLINNHIVRPDRVITEIGRVLHESIPDSFIPILAKLYGHINYTKQHIKQKLTDFKKFSAFSEYIYKCEKDPKCDKKTLPDILLHISIHWSKTVTTINSIISNTINDSHDVDRLTTFKEKIDRIVNEASNVMDNRMNAKLLQSLLDNYDSCPDIEGNDRVIKLMKASSAKLIFNGKLQFELKRSNNGKPLLKEVHGVALEDGIFFLQVITDSSKVTPKYQLFIDRESKFPAILEWGKTYGYFREEVSKNSEAFGFYVIIEKPEASMVRLYVGTPQDRNDWKKVMIEGFSRWKTESSDIKEAEKHLNDQFKKIERKWKNTQFGIELIKNLDNSLRVQLEYRTVGFRCILEEELKRLMSAASLHNSGNSTSAGTEYDQSVDIVDSSNPIVNETFLPDLTTQEGINDWLEIFMEWVNRLKFSLCSSGANITRSASEIEARKRPSIPTVKKCDTFSSSDSPNSVEKRQTDVALFNPSITKQKKDQRRISVSGFTNLFRMNSKAVKIEDTDKESDLTSVATEVTSDVDNITPSNLEMITETDSFISSLSKDTVAAFTAINNAAKNVTLELINLRTKNLALESELKKIHEENQSYREFMRKYQKSIGDHQLSTQSENSSLHKVDSVNSASGVGGLNPSMSSENAPELHDSTNPNSLVHTSQIMGDTRIQTENLRQMVEQFRIEKKQWEKDKEIQRRKNLNENESIFQKNEELKREKANLLEREKKYKENCLNLQKKIDMYNLHNIKLDDDLDKPPLDHSKSQPRIDDNDQRASVRSSVIKSPQVASTEASSFNADQHGHSNNDSMFIPNIPDQLRGSLINQERQSLKTNSSDNILENKGKSTSSSVPKPKLTPSIDRKEMYSSNNICYIADDKGDSDVEDTFMGTKAAVRSSTFDHVETRQTFSSTNVKTTSGQGDDTTTSVTRSNTAPVAPTNKLLGLPLSLASKTQVKKNKPRKSKLFEDAGKSSS